jgi:hypothetical protein
MRGISFVAIHFSFSSYLMIFKYFAEYFFEIIFKIEFKLSELLITEPFASFN